MNIVLIGYRGTGKSSVGRLLAAVLGLERVDMDKLISEKAGLSIPQIVERFGWETFRDMETEVVREVSGKDTCIIDTGGGVILREENVERLKENGFLFWLTAGKETILERIRRGNDRPSLTGKKSFLEEVEEVLKVREPLYRSAADRVVQTEGKQIEEVGAEIIRVLCDTDDFEYLREKLERGLERIEELAEELQD